MNQPPRLLSTRRLAPLAVLLLAFALPGQAATSTYRWVDEKGQVHYGDAIPPQQSGMGHSELDKQGRVVKQAPRTRLSPEEQRRLQQEAEQREAQKRERLAQERRDRALLSTYTREDEIDLTRDRTVKLEQASVVNVRLRLERAKKDLAEVEADIAQVRKIRPRVPPYMLSRRTEAQKQVNQLNDEIRRREQDIEKIRARFDADKARWRVLKGLGD
jgi:hypothetical protein